MFAGKTSDGEMTHWRLAVPGESGFSPSPSGDGTERVVGLFEQVNRLEWSRAGGVARERRDEDLLGQVGI